jgi:hypothetical protein
MRQRPTGDATVKARLRIQLKADVVTPRRRIHMDAVLSKRTLCNCTRS